MGVLLFEMVGGVRMMGDGHQQVGNYATPASAKVNSGFTIRIQRDLWTMRRCLEARQW